MSILKQIYATPSRVLGIYRYIVKKKGQTVELMTLAELLSPPSLNSKSGINDMLKGALNECKSMGLLCQTDDILSFDPHLQPKAVHKEVGEQHLPQTITDLFFSNDNKENHDFALVLAWYLNQDYYSPPGNWKETDEALNEQIGNQKLEMNDTKFGQFEDWACYLGFAWGHASKKSRRLMPDPTIFLKRALPKIVGNSQKPVLLSDVLRELAEVCPVLEGGSFRRKIEAIMGGREVNHLSSATSQALLRLQEEGYIDLLKESDANMIVLSNGEEDLRYTNIILLGDSTERGAN